MSHLKDSPMWDFVEFEWGNWPLKKKVNFEIINFNKVKAEERSSDGWYYVFAAKIYGGLPGLDDQIVVLNIPCKTFERGIKNVSIKKQFIRYLNKEDNVYMEIIKSTRREMKIKEIEQKSHDKKMSKIADRLIYDSGKPAYLIHK